MRKLLLSAAVLLLAGSNAALAGGKPYTYASVYGTYINYSGSDLKSDGYSSTLYVNSGDGFGNAVQIGASYTKINYKNKSDLNQEDFTFVYSNTNGILKNHTFTFGGHYINSDDELTDGGYTLFFDGTYFNYQKVYPYLFNWSGGLGIYYSKYDNKVNFDVLQLTPHASFRLYSSPTVGGVYADLKGYYIHVEKASEIDIGNSNYYSAEADLRYYYKKFDVKVGGWLGKQIFAVKNGGFVVYNLTEKYKGGAFAEFGYSISPRARVSLNLGVNKYKEVETEDDVTQTTATVSFGYSF
ncbi:hypothetical protein SAMN06265339_0188 [Desulfurobacterium pacificum]|uniref:Outer membrane protein beta-barrel domain-containing protein n=1 Tax=Desulfurobacterium pacificum TaxID=240166 RepID=A0ABY1N9P2_9BACT|nr:hypothetical protein [Desulfurobacterium pacificum]SMP04200.1 hypothetical protein SAMN06265339_0188 [Desulfurobacterium pacificum]